MIVAHIFGLPVEETIPGFAPAGIAAFIMFRLMRERTCRLTTRLVRPFTHLRRARPLRQQPDIDELDAAVKPDATRSQRGGASSS